MGWRCERLGGAGREDFEDGTSKPLGEPAKEMKVGSSTGSATRRAIRLVWVAFAVQAVAVTFHRTWHAVAFDEPPNEVGHYLLLHGPLHLGVILLGVAALFAEAPHGAAALLFIAGGTSALAAADLRRRSRAQEAA